MPAKVAAVIVAGGRGYRAGGDMPKQYRRIGGEPVIRPTAGGVSRIIRKSPPSSRSSTRTMGLCFTPRPRA